MSIDDDCKDKRAIACNYLVATPECVRGALAYVCFVTGGEVEKIEVLSRSRNGRWIKRWENLSILDNFRFKTIPPEHPLYNDSRIRTYWLTPKGEETNWLEWLILNSKWNRQRENERTLNYLLSEKASKEISYE